MCDADYVVPKQGAPYPTPRKLLATYDDDKALVCPPGSFVTAVQGYTDESCYGATSLAALGPFRCSGGNNTQSTRILAGAVGDNTAATARDTSPYGFSGLNLVLDTNCDFAITGVSFVRRDGSTGSWFGLSSGTKIVPLRCPSGMVLIGLTDVFSIVSDMYSPLVKYYVHQLGLRCGYGELCEAVDQTMGCGSPSVSAC